MTTSGFNEAAVLKPIFCLPAAHIPNKPTSRAKMGAVGGIGAKLLSKMGWEEGTGLGARRDGRVEPLSVGKRAENLGIGAERRPFLDAWWERTLEDAYGKPSAEKDVDLLDACEGRRCRPHGSAKLARLERHDNEAAVDNVEAEDESECKLKRKREKRRLKEEKKLKIASGRVKKARKTKKGGEKKRKERKNKKSKTNEDFS